MLLVTTVQEKVAALGLSSKEQAANIKVFAGKKRLYFSKGKKKVGQVHITGFGPLTHPAIREITAEEARAQKIGKVRAEIDFTKTDEEVLSAVDTLLAELATEQVKIDRLPKIEESAKKLQGQATETAETAN